MAAGGGQGVHRRDPLPEIRAHGRGAVPAGGAADHREERRPGARVLPPPDQGLPDLEVHPGRVPRVRRARVRDRRDGGGAEVLREGRAVPEVQRLPVRRLQEGLVPREPGRLPDRAGDVRRRRAPDAVREAVGRPEAAGGAGEGGEERRGQGVRAGEHCGPGAAIFREGRRRVRAQDDGAARRALLGGRQGAGVDARLQADHRRQHGEPARVRVAEQGAAQHAVAAELRQGAGGAGAGAAGQRVREGAADKKRAGGRVPRVVPRRRPRAGADLAPRGAEDAGPGDLRVRGARLRPVPRPFSRRQAGLRDALLPGRAAVGAAALEGRRRAIHGGRRVTAGRQTHARGGVRGGAGLEEREHGRRRGATAGAGSRARTPERGPGVRQGRGADDPGQPAEDDRRVPHLREAGARRGRAARDDLPRGVHLLRPRPARRAPSRFFSKSFRSTRNTSWPCSPPTCSSTR